MKNNKADHGCTTKYHRVTSDTVILITTILQETLTAKPLLMAVVSPAEDEPVTV